MTATAEARTGTGRDGADPVDRGRTVIGVTVVARIAEQAASEAGALGVPGRGSGPSARARRSGGSVDVRVTVALPYPGPLRSAGGDVRSRVAGRIAELTGFTVRRVDIEVAELVTVQGGPR